MKTIYISGSITDPTTGQPRKNWQQAFYEAEKKLINKGFVVVNPAEIAETVEMRYVKRHPAQQDYLIECLTQMHYFHLIGHLQALYVIGSKNDPYAMQRIYHSHGVQMELHMAKVLGIPVFAEFYDGAEIDIHLLPVKDGLQIADNGQFVKETWGQHFMDDRGHFQSEDVEE